MKTFSSAILLFGLIAAPVAAQQQLVSKETATQGGVTRAIESFIDPQSVVSESGITGFNYDVVVRNADGSLWNHHAARAGVDCTKRDTVAFYVRESYISGGEANHYLMQRYENPMLERVVPGGQLESLVGMACETAY